MQTLTLAMDMRRDSIAVAITDLFGEITIIERNEAPVRKAEGLELRTGVLRGNAPSQIEIEIGGVKFEVESSARTKNRFLPRSRIQLWDRCWIRARPARAGLFHKSGGICIDLRAGRRIGRDRR